jgi:predicted dienelactone hydrolase
MKRVGWVLVLPMLAAGLWWATARAAETPQAPAPPPSDAQAPAAPYSQSAGPLEVATVTYDWVDAARERKVPVKIYYPKAGPGPYPIIIFSHGLGGSRDGYEYLGRYWAGYGFVSVHVQHIGSDSAVWKGVTDPLRVMRDAADDPRNAINRPLDVRFAIDQMIRLNAEEGPLKGRLDTARVGAAGHSFGAYTTLCVAGMVFITARGQELSLPDSRIKAAIAMSSPVTATDWPIFDKKFGKIRIPMFHMTGTRDDSPISKTTAKDRRVPYDHSHGSDQYLVTFEGGDHMIFAGSEFAIGREKDAEFQRLIRQGSVAFWEAYLKGDAKAKAWLAGGGFEGVLGAEGKFEHKSPKPAEANPFAPKLAGDAGPAAGRAPEAPIPVGRAVIP